MINPIIIAAGNYQKLNKYDKIVEIKEQSSVSKLEYLINNNKNKIYYCIKLLEFRKV